MNDRPISVQHPTWCDHRSAPLAFPPAISASPVRTHPTWCHPLHCAVRPDGARHSSAPESFKWSTDDVQIAVSLSHSEELDLDGTPLFGATVLLAVGDLESVMPDGCLISAAVHLTPADADQLSLALAAFAARARRAEREAGR